MLIKKIPDTSGLMTATVLNTKISEVENKTLDTTNLTVTNVPNIIVHYHMLTITKITFN